MYGEPTIEPPDVIATATSAEPTVDQIFDKYIQALGGAARLASLTSYTAKGTAMPYGDPDVYKAEIYAKAPNQLATFVHQQEGDMVRTFDGRQGYFILPLTVVEEYPWTGGANEGAKLDAALAFRAGHGAVGASRHLLLRLGFGSVGANGAVREFGRWPRTDADRLRRVQAGRRCDDAVQVVVCVGERPRGIFDDRHPTERRR
jgi:hypothetical protein